jgi:hypothetical protein
VKMKIKRKVLNYWRRKVKLKKEIEKLKSKLNKLILNQKR